MKLKEIKLGTIEQYAQVVKKDRIQEFKNRGWYEWSQFDDFIESDLDAFLVYGDINLETETLLLKKPQSLQNYPLNSLIHRKITGFSCHLGTYGMGGAGFFGLLLNDKEYLTYAVWNAGHYTIVDGLVVESFPSLNLKQRPLVSNFTDAIGDDLSTLIIGTTIDSFELFDDKFSLTIVSKTTKHQIEFVRNDSRIPRKTSRMKNAYKKGSISDYLVFQEKDAILIV